MLRGENNKQKLTRIVIFGANSRIGKPCARYIADNSPETRLRLCVRSEAHVSSLKQEFPDADVLIADYYDLASLERAFEGVNGAFVVTPDFLDEERAMTNFVFAARTAGSGLIHLVRVLADPPGMSTARIPDVMRQFGAGTALQHLRARAVLETSGLPFTYINIASYFMQNFSGPLFNIGLREHRVLSCPRNRRMGFLDTDDMGACAGAILLSDNHRHIGQTYHLDNGNDVIWFDEVAELMTEVWGEEITFDGSDETFDRYTGDLLRAFLSREDIVDYTIGYFQFEQDNETIWRKSDIVEYLTGRKAKTLEEWLIENETAVLG